MQTLRIRGPRSGRPAVQTSLFGQARNPEREVTCPRPRKPAEKPGLPSRVLRETAARCTSGKPGSLVGYLRRSRPSRFHGRPRGRTPPPRPHRPALLAPRSGSRPPRGARGWRRRGPAPRFRPGPRPLAAAAAPGPRAALGSQPRGRGGGGGGAGISLGAALTAPLCRSPSGGARWAAQSAFVRAVSHRITRIMRPPGPGRRAGRHRVATGGSRGRAAPPAPAPAREIPIEAAPPAPAPRRMARGRVNGAAAAAGAGPGRAVGGGARAPFKPPKPLRAARAVPPAERDPGLACAPPSRPVAFRPPTSRGPRPTGAARVPGRPRPRLRAGPPWGAGPGLRERCAPRAGPPPPAPLALKACVCVGGRVCRDERVAARAAWSLLRGPS